MPVVSVLIPAYNCARFLPQTLASVFAQTFTDFEVLVIDDGSSDDTAGVLRATSDPRLVTIRQTNAGVSAARNHGLRLAKGRFVLLLDADDLITPNHLERKLAHLDAHSDCIAVMSAAEFFDDATGETLGVKRPGETRIYERLLALHPDSLNCLGSALLFRAEILPKVGSFDESLPATEDRDFVLRLLTCGRLDVLPEVLARIRRRRGSLSANIAGQAAALPFVVRRGGRLRPDLPAEFIRFCEARAWLTVSGGYFHQGGRPDLSIRFALRSLMVHPRPLWNKLLRRPPFEGFMQYVT